MQARLRSVVALTMLALGMSLTFVPSSAQAAPAKPTVGQCHDLTMKQADLLSDIKKPVRCSQEHTLQTVGVPVSRTSFVGLTIEELSEAGRQLCAAPLRRALGGTHVKRAKTAYRGYYFLPTVAQRTAGARWVRCDVAIMGAKSLRPLPKLSRPILKGSITDREARCLTKNGTTTACDTPHAYRAATAFVSRSVAYPGREGVIAELRRRCHRGFDYATWQSEGSWAASGRVVVCYDKTRR